MLISGGRDADKEYNVLNTTEVITGKVTQVGPNLGLNMSFRCQVIMQFRKIHFLEEILAHRPCTYIISVNFYYLLTAAAVYYTRQPRSYFHCKQTDRAAPIYNESLWKWDISYAFPQAFTVFWSSTVGLFITEVAPRLSGD